MTEQEYKTIRAYLQSRIKDIKEQIEVCETELKKHPSEQGGKLCNYLYELKETLDEEVDTLDGKYFEGECDRLHNGEIDAIIIPIAE